ncbi:MAG: SCP2 sterol-binding domain-containing protein [Thermoflexales bacterium]|nr:SCP2 sterol-binding domain-containing protein [Thermoflexales bacterium]
MGKLKYLSPEWTRAALKRLREGLTPDKTKYLTTSMLIIYVNCPDGQDRALYYRLVDGVVDEIAIQAGDLPEAEFRISAEYETLAKIARAQMDSRAALLAGELRLRGSLVRALSLSVVVDRINAVLATIPTEY